jgi:outer membrane protein OmpA-like peptidoglycan-associated protein
VIRASHILIRAALFLMLLAPATAAAQDECRRARDIYARSLSMERDGAISQLEKAVELCPSLHEAQLRLGHLHEQAGRLEEAREAYRRSIRSDPADPATWAGLAGIAYARGRYETAAGYYRRVLDRLSQADNRPGLDKLRALEPQLRHRYERARIKAGAHFDSQRRVVSTTRLIEALTPPANAPQAPRPRVRERVALDIGFEFDSPRLSARGRQQLERVARAMNSESLKASDFLIEGHTDTLGDAYNNLYLSLLRARAVRDFLVDQGVSRQRLRVIGLGQTRPLVLSGSSEDQAFNRRVEFVNLGK